MVVISKPPFVTSRMGCTNPTIFLGGSIEMGKAIDWQNMIQEEAKKRELDVTFFNPRRDEWDASWIQSIDNPQFKQQVDWELDHIEKADIVVMYFAPGTQSPISLLELGILVGNPDTQHKLMVCCPEGFWRKGNVDIVCDRVGIPVYRSLEELNDSLMNLIAFMDRSAKRFGTSSGGPR